MASKGINVLARYAGYTADIANIYLYLPGDELILSQSTAASCDLFYQMQVAACGVSCESWKALLAQPHRREICRIGQNSDAQILILNTLPVKTSESQSVEATLVVQFAQDAFSKPLSKIAAVDSMCISIFPHFISLVVVCGMLTQFCLSDGMFNAVRGLFGLTEVSLLQDPKYYRTIYIGSGIWQQIGWNSIIYLAAIAGIDSQLYEAAALDGAGRFSRIVHITLPGIRPTIVILFIMQVGKLMSLGYEKTILLYNPATYEVSDIISSYVYRRGLVELNWSFSSAVGLFNSVVNFALVYLVNLLSGKLTDSSLF